MKKLVLVLFLFSCAGFSCLYYFWRQATQLPEWYTTESVDTQETLDLSNESESLATKARLQAKIDASIAKAEAADADPSPLLRPPTSTPNRVFESTELKSSKGKNVELELSNREVNELVVMTIADKIASKGVLATTPSVRTTIKDGAIETGAVVNFADLSNHQSVARKEAALEKAIAAFPLLKDRDVYVAVSAKPRIENGQIKLDDGTEIKVGNLRLTLSELAQRLDVPPEKLEQQLNLSLELGRFQVSDVELSDDKVLLRGSAEE